MNLLKKTYLAFLFRGVSISLYFLVTAIFSQNNPQSQNIFINQDVQQTIDLLDVKNPSLEFHSSFKPYVSSTLDHFSDTAVGFLHYPIKNFFLSKTIHDNPNKRHKYAIQFLPLIDLQIYQDVKKPNPLADKQAMLPLQPLALSSPFIPPQFQSYLNNFID